MIPPNRRTAALRIARANAGQSDARTRVLDRWTPEVNAYLPIGTRKVTPNRAICARDRIGQNRRTWRDFEFLLTRM